MSLSRYCDLFFNSMILSPPMSAISKVFYMDMNNFLDEKACDIDTNFDERVRACSNLALRLAFGV